MDIKLSVQEVHGFNALIRIYDVSLPVETPVNQWMNAADGAGSVYYDGANYFIQHTNSLGNRLFHYAFGRPRSGTRLITSDQQILIYLSKSSIAKQSTHKGDVLQYVENVPAWEGWQCQKIADDLYAYTKGMMLVHLYLPHCVDADLPNWVMDFPKYIPQTNDLVIARIEPYTHLDSQGIGCSASIVKLSVLK